ncbi:hypothetical protein QR685DRAFT_355908 [Neurospora intermedia]|uniref:Uncharacterized protein n=1 Tax=Neurospora intermedia TaxID=5142 RepID=A0ABR3D5R2_NEUIN
MDSLLYFESQLDVPETRGWWIAHCLDVTSTEPTNQRNLSSPSSHPFLKGSRTVTCPVPYQSVSLGGLGGLPMLPILTAEQQASFKRSSYVPMGSLQCRRNSPSTTPRNGHMLCLFTQQFHGGANCWLSDSALSFSAHTFRRRISVRGLADRYSTCDIYTALDAGKTFGEDETASSWRSYDVIRGPLLFVKLSWHLHCFAHDG